VAGIQSLAWELPYAFNAAILKKLCNFAPAASVSMLCFQMQGLNLAAGVEGMNAFIMISYSCGRRQVYA